VLSRLHAAASDLTVQPALLLARWCSSHCRHFMLLAAALPVPSHTLLSLCYGLTCRDGLLECLPFCVFRTWLDFGCLDCWCWCRLCQRADICVRSLLALHALR